MKKTWQMVLNVIICILHIIPFYILLTTSLKKANDFSSKWMLPKYVDLRNFSNVWMKGYLGTALWNNIIITCVSVFFIIVLGSLAAYPLARYKTRWNAFMYTFFVSLLIIPPLTILVPLYKFIVNLGWLNTYKAIIILHVTFSLPVTIFLYTGFINTIPRELDEAAMIDGSSRIGLFFRIIIPLLQPVTATVVIFTGVQVWNDYQFSVFFLQKPEMQNITVGLARFFNEFGNNIAWVAAGSLIGMIPMTMLYLFLQKYFIHGLSSGAIKG